MEQKNKFGECKQGSAGLPWTVVWFMHWTKCLVLGVWRGHWNLAHILTNVQHSTPVLCLQREYFFLSPFLTRGNIFPGLGLQHFKFILSETVPFHSEELSIPNSPQRGTLHFLKSLHAGSLSSSQWSQHSVHPTWWSRRLFPITYKDALSCWWPGVCGTKGKFLLQNSSVTSSWTTLVSKLRFFTLMFWRLPVSRPPSPLPQDTVTLDPCLTQVGP